MNCPFCNCADTKVSDSRPSADGKSIRRRRECLSCNKRWRTLERMEEKMPLVLKKNGNHSPFEKEKLLHSLRIATGKRPVSPAQIEQTVADIEWELLESGLEVVPSQMIGEKVMSALRELDEISYIRFASVYRRFKDVGELMAEMNDLVEKRDSAQSPVVPTASA